MAFQSQYTGTQIESALGVIVSSLEEFGTFAGAEAVRAATFTAAEVNRDASQATREAALQAKADQVMTINPDGTYYTKNAIDNSLNLMTRAEFEAVAGHRRNHFAGSGFVEWGKHESLTQHPKINEGMWVLGTSIQPNLLIVGESGGTSAGVSTSPSPIVSVHGFRINVRNSATSNKTQNLVSFPPAPSTSALLDRQDLVFLEVWHEDVSEKDFVYPYGNVQFGATTYTKPDAATIATVNGAFAGFGTYSLFGSWQAASALIGKGMVWSTMTDANKRAFCSDPENNMYLDGTKIIQVRYRIRVVEGLGSSWAIVSHNSSLTGIGASMQYSASAYAIPKGKQVVISYDLGLATGKGFFAGNGQYGNKVKDVFEGVSDAGTTTTTVGHNGLCFALPIALVHRRNRGGFHPVFNPNGCNNFANSTGNTAVPWYSSAIRTRPVSTADCFVFATSGYPYTDGIIYGRILDSEGGIASTRSGRPDGLFYDEINERDVRDLRNSAIPVRDQKRLLEREFNKLVAGTTRGWEKGKKITLTPYDGTSMRFRYSASFNFSVANYHSSVWGPHYRGVLVPIYITDLKFTDILVLLPNHDNSPDGLSLNKAYWLSDGISLNTGSSIAAQLEARLVLTELGNDGTNYRWYNDLRLIESISLPASSKTILHCDIIGDPANYYRGKYTFKSSSGLQTINTGDVVLADSINTGGGGAGTAGRFYKRLGGQLSINLTIVDYTVTAAWEDLGTNREDSWLTNGVAGTPLLVAEDGVTSLIPNGTSKTFKLSRKVKTALTSVYSDNNGGSWTSFNLGTAWPGVTSATNAHAETQPTGRIILVFYLTEASSFELAANAEVLGLGDVWAGNYGGLPALAILCSTLIEKIPTNQVTHTWKGRLLSDSLNVDDRKLSASSNLSPIMHGVVSLGASNPAVKVLPYLTRANGKAYLQMLYKEMTYDSAKDYNDITTITAGIAFNVTVGALARLSGFNNQFINGTVVQFLLATNTSWPTTGFDLFLISTDGVLRDSAGVPFANCQPWDGNGWGDDNKFNVVDNESTVTDLNAKTVKVGQKRLELPFFIADGE